MTETLTSTTFAKPPLVSSPRTAAAADHVPRDWVSSCSQWSFSEISGGTAKRPMSPRQAPHRAAHLLCRPQLSGHGQHPGQLRPGAGRSRYVGSSDRACRAITGRRVVDSEEGFSLTPDARPALRPVSPPRARSGDLDTRRSCSELNPWRAAAGEGGGILSPFPSPRCLVRTDLSGDLRPSAIPLGAARPAVPPPCANRPKREGESTVERAAEKATITVDRTQPPLASLAAALRPSFHPGSATELERAGGSAAASGSGSGSGSQPDPYCHVGIGLRPAGRRAGLVGEPARKAVRCAQPCERPGTAALLVAAGWDRLEMRQLRSQPGYAFVRGAMEMYWGCAARAPEGLSRAGFMAMARKLYAVHAGPRGRLVGGAALEPHDEAKCGSRVWIPRVDPARGSRAGS